MPSRTLQDLAGKPSLLQPKMAHIDIRTLVAPQVPERGEACISEMARVGRAKEAGLGEQSKLKTTNPELP